MSLFRILFLIILVSFSLTAGANPSHAAVVFSQTFEVFSDNDGCPAITTTDPNITQCRGTGTVGVNTSLITIENGVPGYGGALPSGSKVMRDYVNSVDAQQDAGIRIGGGTDYIPADVWVQFAMFVNNGGGEVSYIPVNSPMKLWYPCNGAYPCGSGVSSGYIVVSGGKGSSYAPFNDASLIAETDGDMYLNFRDNTAGTINWAGAAPGDESKLGQTSLAEWIKPGRWNIVKMHLDFTDTASGKLDCWIGAMGSALTHVASWHGGTTVEGYSFTWTLPSATGHTAAWLPSTQPGNNTWGLTNYIYFGDYYVATLEADLPTYGSDVTPPDAPEWLLLAREGKE